MVGFVRIAVALPLSIVPPDSLVLVVSGFAVDDPSRITVSLGTWKS